MENCRGKGYEDLLDEAEVMTSDRFFGLVETLQGGILRDFIISEFPEAFREPHFHLRLLRIQQEPCKICAEADSLVWTPMTGTTEMPTRKVIRSPARGSKDSLQKRPGTVAQVAGKSKAAGQ